MSYLIREIYSQYDQYYDNINNKGRKNKQIEGLLGKRKMNEM